jgi:hypothetical protein
MISSPACSHYDGNNAARSYFVMAIERASFFVGLVGAITYNIVRLYIDILVIVDL